MASISTLISSISNQNIRFFFENKITSFKPEKEIFTNTVKEDAPYSDPVKIGHAELFNHEELLVFSCEYNGELTERSAKKRQFEIAKKVLKEDFKDGAIFIFYDAQGNFRFSFIRRNYGHTGDKKYSTWKRYTYYVTKSETNRTFKERIDNCHYDSLDNIQEAFSVEKLTKQFYNELFAWYQWALSDEIGITYPNNTKTSDDDRVKLEEQVIRLITRLLFVWFIKQKKLVPEYLFDTNELANTLKDFDGDSAENGNYYNAILQNLFFATLNKEISEREFAKTKNRDIKTRYRYEDMFTISETEILELFKPIPFLNGGLFECLDKQDADGNKYFLDGFSRNPTKSANGNYRHRAFLPNCLFFDEEKGIIPLLRRYNFTVEENAPNEVQVALDPELLGKVFENLLGAFNPETKETARKQSGSFYTPREIVDYMVDESLINYLITKITHIEEDTLRDLFENEQISETLLNNTNLRNNITLQLKAIRILDPACGSGAFPMGILNKMVEVLEKLDATDESIHDLKLHLIEDCIYGIDIQPIAIQISKLRFFISLVVEQEAININKPEDNYGILTLPNLETKFVAANTLIGIKAKPKQHNLFEDPLVEETKQELLAVRHEHFYAKTAGAKKRLREQDAILRDSLSRLLEQNKDFAPEDALQLSQWNPYDQNTSSSFFDIEWMFGLQKGFDVVIGNPPYIQIHKFDKVIKDLWKDQDFESYTATGDIYGLFYEKGIKLLNHSGLLCYITSNKWMRSAYGQKLREYFITKNPLKLIDFVGNQIFSSAAVDTNILIIQNSTNKNLMKGASINEFLDFSAVSGLNYYLRSFLTFTDLSNEPWAIISEDKISLKNKIQKSGRILEDWNIEIFRGVTTGCNAVFIINEELRNGIINNDKSSLNYIHPVIRGVDMKKFTFKWSKDYILFTRRGYDLETSKNIKNYLIQHRARLEPKPKDYKSKIKWKGRKSGPYKWFEIQDNTKYFQEFQKHKVCWMNMNRQWKFAFVPKGFYVEASCNFISSNDYALFLTGILSSNLHLWYFKQTGRVFDDGGFMCKVDSISGFPVPYPSSSLKLKVEELVRTISKDANLIDSINELNILVYKLYNLNIGEVLIIDPEFSLTNEEYDNYKI